MQTALVAYCTKSCRLDYRNTEAFFDITYILDTYISLYTSCPITIDNTTFILQKFGKLAQPGEFETMYSPKCY